MRQFKLQEYLDNPDMEVVTREGKPVRIICTDSPIKNHPIVGFIGDKIFVWAADGRYFCDADKDEVDMLYGIKDYEKLDLFFTDKCAPEENI